MQWKAFPPLSQVLYRCCECNLVHSSAFFTKAEDLHIIGSRDPGYMPQRNVHVQFRKNTQGCSEGDSPQWPWTQRDLQTHRQVWIRRCKTWTQRTIPQVAEGRGLEIIHSSAQNHLFLGLLHSLNQITCETKLTSRAFSGCFPIESGEETKTALGASFNSGQCVLVKSPFHVRFCWSLLVDLLLFEFFLVWDYASSHSYFF